MKNVTFFFSSRKSEVQTGTLKSIFYIENREKQTQKFRNSIKESVTVCLL